MSRSDKPQILGMARAEIAQTHFLNVARLEMERVRVTIPLMVSHRELLERQGPLGQAWLTANHGWEPVRPEC